MIERLSVKFNGAPYFPEAFELPKLRTLKYESTLNSPGVQICSLTNLVARVCLLTLPLY